MLISIGAMLSMGQSIGYDFTKTYAKRYDMMEDSFGLHIIGSVNAAFLATAFSAPFDILLTRYQSAGIMGKQYRSVLHCAQDMVKHEGIAVFYRGWSPFFLRLVPSFVLMLPLYEQVRSKIFNIGYMT